LREVGSIALILLHQGASEDIFSSVNIVVEDVDDGWGKLIKELSISYPAWWDEISPTILLVEQ
jgi:hypothetical protein